MQLPPKSEWNMVLKSLNGFAKAYGQKITSTPLGGSSTGTRSTGTRGGTTRGRRAGSQSGAANPLI
jgi:hypothetical protein